MYCMHHKRIYIEYTLIYIHLYSYIGISLAFNRKLDIITTALPMITKAETLRKLGVKKFPIPEPGEDIALKGVNIKKTESQQQQQEDEDEDE